MDSRLIPREHLRVAGRTRERAPAHVALAVLVVSVGVLAWLQRGSWSDAPAPAGQPTATMLTAATIAGSNVPAPPSSYRAAMVRARGGSHVFVVRGKTMSPGSAASLFGYYLKSMPTAGWTLLAKGDPAKAGDWSQRWQQGQDAALLTLNTRPTDSFTVELCPPDPYC
jgi:hypothetical protein